MKSKKKKRSTKTYVVEFRIEVDAPDDIPDDTPFIVEQDIRKFLVEQMSKREFNRVEFGFVDDVGALEVDDDDDA